MKFANPDLLALLALVPLVAALMAYSAWRARKLLSDFAGRQMWERIRPSYSPARSRAKIALLLIGLSLSLFTLTRPQFGVVFEKMNRKGLDLVVLVDVSRSMMAEDFKPSRLAKAKHAVSALIDKLHGDRIAIVPFAGEPFVLCPLTLDYSAAKLFLDVVDDRTIPVQGTAIGKAIEKGLEAFDSTGRKYKAMILLTDGEDHQGNPVDFAKKAAEQGVRIYTVGIGGETAVPIPDKDPEGKSTGFKKDRSGKMVLSRLDETTLEKVALLTDGKYYRASYGEMELTEILAEINKLERRKIDSRVVTRYKERYQWFLGLAFAALALEAVISERRRKSSKGGRA